MKKLTDFLIAIFYTRRCRYCRTVIDIRERVCSRCKNEIFRIEGDVCFKCGYSQNECVCKKKSQHYMRICAPYYYSGAAKRAIKRLKYSEDIDISYTLAEDMAETFKKHYSEMDFDYCTFVPSHRREQRKRGYNQAQLLAQHLSKELGIPCKELLVKTAVTKPQHTLNESMRSGNLLGSIQVKSRYFKKIQGARILLCDDVKTTGSTLNECAKTLMICGAAEVDCITYCIAKNDKKTKNSES